MNYEILKQECKKKGYSVSSLATEIGISKSNITNWKNGGNPSYKTLIKIAQALECSVGYLLGAEDVNNTSNATVNAELRNIGSSSARTISLKCGAALQDSYLIEIAEFANCSILFLCGHEKELIRVAPDRTKAQITNRCRDKLIEIFDSVNEIPIIENIQMQLCRIILCNLGVSAANQISDELLRDKADFILNGTMNKDTTRNYPFNLSDLLVLGDLFDKSIEFMISGLNDRGD